MAKIQLTEENSKIMHQLIWDFSHATISATNTTRDIVALIAEMTMQAIQLSQENKDENNN